MIELRDVAIDVGGRRLLDGITASVKSGELLAVLGPNGAGKTTLLRTIAALHPTAGGTVLFDGAPIARLSAIERARRIAFVASDQVMVESLRTREVVAIGRYPHRHSWPWQRYRADEAAIDAALHAAGIERFADRLFSTLSMGEQQRVWIALGLAQETPVLLLDEPTSHLDVRAAHEILSLLRSLAGGVAQGKTIVCALHDLNEAAAYADRIALLAEGGLLALDRPGVLLRGQLLEQAYGIAMSSVALVDGTLRVFTTRERPTPRPNA